MYSPPSSPSVLASTSRHNIIQPQTPSQHRQQKSLRLFLGHQSDEEPSTSDCDFEFHSYAKHDDEDSDSDDDLLGVASGSGQRLQPGRSSGSRSYGNAFESPSRRSVSHRAYDGDEGGLFRLPSPSKRLGKRSKAGSSPQKASIFASAPTSKQQAATSAAIPATPTKRQKGFLIRGNVTPSRAFSIFKAAKQRSNQRQQHGLMTPPTSSPLRPIILDSFDDGDDSYVDASPSRQRVSRAPNAAASPSSARSLRTTQARYTLSSSAQKRSAFASQRSPPTIRPSAFAANHSLPNTLHSLRTRQSHFSSGLSTAPHRFSAARTPVIDTTSFLETFVSPSSCVVQLPRSSDDELLSHPICAAYSYSSRSVNPSAQWLAVGDDEGRITLLNTLPWQDASAELFASNPQWQASSSSTIFELAWRFDDRSILSGASDFSIRSWDTEYQKCTTKFDGHRGSPRTIVYDPTTNGDGGCGMVFASAGRDGTIRIWDARVSERGSQMEEDEDGCAAVAPVLTINGAHGTVGPVAPVGGAKGRKQPRNGAGAAVARGRKRLQQPLPAGITALSYLPDGQGHKLLSGGSANGVIKCWDLRHVRSHSSPHPASQVDTQKTLEPVTSLWDTPDVSLLAPSTTFARAHGVSQIISSATCLYASCTGGKIYSLPLSTFLDSHLTPSEVQTLYDPVQCQNTLFSRMALYDDRFLAVGCNTGNVALWDVTARRGLASGQEQTDTEDERMAARRLETGFGHRSSQQGMAVLTEGHAKNTEVNAVAWANGPMGPTLSSVGDDTKVRTWYAHRSAREGLAHAAEE